MRKGESELAPGDTVQQQPAAVPQELPMLQHTGLSISTLQRRRVLKIKLYNINYIIHEEQRRRKTLVAE